MLLNGEQGVLVSLSLTAMFKAAFVQCLREQGFRLAFHGFSCNMVKY